MKKFLKILFIGAFVLNIIGFSYHIAITTPEAAKHFSSEDELIPYDLPDRH